MDDRPRWSVRELFGTLYVSPRADPDFGWAFLSRILFVMAYAFFTAYQAYYLIDRLGTAETRVPHQILLSTVVQSSVVIVASLVGGRFSDRVGRRKIFALAAAVIYGLAMFLVALAHDFAGFLIGVALSGLGFGVYVAVDLALVTDVLRDNRDAAKNLGVFNIANALPYSIAPALAPAILAVAHRSYTALFAVAGICGLLAAVSILPVKRVR